MSWRCHRSRASGRTRKVCHLRLGSSWARRPGRARSASKRGWPTWRCSYGELVAQDQDLDVLVTSGSEVKDDQLEGGPYRAGEKPEGHRAGSVVAVSPRTPTREAPLVSVRSNNRHSQGPHARAAWDALAQPRQRPVSAKCGESMAKPWVLPTSRANRDRMPGASSRTAPHRSQTR